MSQNGHFFSQEGPKIRAGYGYGYEFAIAN